MGVFYKAYIFIHVKPFWGTLKLRKMGWAGVVSRKDARNAHRIVVGKLEAKRSLGRFRLRWRIISKGSEDCRFGNVNWILSQDMVRRRVFVNTIIKT